MASGVGELEALLATPHSAFLSSSTIDSPEGTHQYNLAFRETLISRHALSTTPSQTEAYAPTQDGVRPFLMLPISF